MEAEDFSSLADAVTTPEQARLLLESDNYYLIERLMSGEYSASELSRDLGMRLETLYYHLKQFERHGLARVVRTRKRRGRA